MALLTPKPDNQDVPSYVHTPLPDHMQRSLLEYATCKDSIFTGTVHVVFRLCIAEPGLLEDTSATMSIPELRMYKQSDRKKPDTTPSRREESSKTIRNRMQRSSESRCQIVFAIGPVIKTASLQDVAQSHHIPSQIQPDGLSTGFVSALCASLVLSSVSPDGCLECLVTTMCKIPNTFRSDAKLSAPCMK